MILYNSARKFRGCIIFLGDFYSLIGGLIISLYVR